MIILLSVFHKRLKFLIKYIPIDTKNFNPRVATDEIKQMEKENDITREDYFINMETLSDEQVRKEFMQLEALRQTLHVPLECHEPGPHSS